MAMTIKARFTNGVLKPLGDTGLKEGEELTLTIAPASPTGAEDWLARTAGGWAGLIDGEELKKAIYESRLLLSRREPRL